MNLNKFKKTIGKNNPEKGLRNLVGAQKDERRDSSSGTIRVTGKYISGDKELNLTGRVLGLIAYISAWITGLLMLVSLLMPSVNLPHPFATFIFGLLVVNGCAMLADGFRGSDAPWAMKGIIIFWSAAVLTFVISLVS